MNKFVKAIALLIFILTFFSGCFLLPNEEEPLAPPLIEPEEVEYKTEIVELGDISKESIVMGVFKPGIEITLSFEDRGGYLLESNVNYGQKVKKGDFLFALDIDDLEKQQKLAALDLEKAELSYNRTKNSTSSSYYRRMAEIEVEKMQIAYDQITTEIEKSRIYSSIDGVITYMSNANIGDYVSAGKTMIKVADESELRLLVQGSDALKLKFGDSVSVSINIGEERLNLKGEVIMSPLDKPDNMEESFEESTAIIAVEGLDTSHVRINKTAKITVVEDIAQNVIVISRNLIRNYYGRTFVYVLDDGIKIERDVEVGIQNTIKAEIREGLEVGEEIIDR